MTGIEARRRIVQRRQGVCPVREHLDGETGFLQQFLQKGAEPGFIIDHHHPATAVVTGGGRHRHDLHLCGQPRGQRQQYLDAGAPARLALNENMAAIAVHDAIDHR